MSNVTRRQFMKCIGAGAAVAVLPTEALAAQNEIQSNEKRHIPDGERGSVAKCQVHLRRGEIFFCEQPIGSPIEITGICAGETILSPEHYEITSNDRFVGVRILDTIELQEAEETIGSVFTATCRYTQH
jgi:hypothetical protein